MARPRATLGGNVHSEVRKYGPFDKKTRKEKAVEIEGEVRPALDESAGVHAFGVVDADDVLTAVTIYESRDAAEASAKRPPRGAGSEAEIVATEISVKKVARAAPAKRARSRRR
jgi:hypothetical protein